jgi:type VI secretion system secreted protein VgrG
MGSLSDITLHTLYGNESLCESFCYKIQFWSKDAGIDLSTLIGKTGHVELSNSINKKKRTFEGVIEFAQLCQADNTTEKPLVLYEVHLYPLLNSIRYNNNYRIFQDEKTIDIIKKILSENAITALDSKVSSLAQSKREYCVQYGESHFDFISRLMEEEGLFYYYSFDSGTHKLTLGEKNDHFKPDLGDIPYQKSAIHEGAPREDSILYYSFIQKMVTHHSARADYNFLTAASKLYTKTGDASHYEYPGRFDILADGTTLTKRDQQSFAFDKKVLKGRGTVLGFHPGGVFQFNKKKYIIVDVEHTLEWNLDKGTYLNSFTAIPFDTDYRQLENTPKPKIYSNQTAIVTGKASEEIWCDEYGRIKVKFHWDQKGPSDEKSSCWIRVSQVWGGAGWGGLFIPRIGQEVIVTFLDGNPDRPLVIGCVYNSTHKPPYLPDHPTYSTIKTQSSKNDSGFNELRFDDLKGSEEIYMHAQKDMVIDIIHNRTTTLEKGDDSLTLKEGNRTKLLTKGNETITLTKGNQSTTLTEGNQTTELTKGNQKTTLDKGDQSVTLTDGNQTITLSKGNQSITLDKGNCEFTITQGNYQITLANGNLTIAAAAGAISIQGKDIAIQGQTVSIVGANGVVISGATVAIG